MGNSIKESILGAFWKIEGFNLPSFNIKQGFEYLIKFLSKFNKDKCLIVLDNANNATELEETRRDFRKANWDVLVTTRSNYEYHVIDIPHLNSNELEDLFYLNCSCEKENKVANRYLLNTLFEEIEYHTFLVLLIAKAINNNPMLSIRSSYELLKENRIDDIELQSKIDVTYVNEKYNTVEEVRLYEFILSIFKLINLNDNDIHILRLFSIIPSIAIPYETLIAYFRIGSEISYSFYDIFLKFRDNKKVKPMQQADFLDTINKLTKLGWLQKFGSDYKCHPLLQTVVRGHAKVNSYNCYPLLDTFTVDALTQDKYESQPIKYEREILYAQKIVDNLHKEVIESNNFQKKLTRFFRYSYRDLQLATMSDIIHRYFMHIEDFENAKRYCNLAHSIRQKIVSQNDIAFVTSLNSFAVLYKHLSMSFTGTPKQKMYFEKAIGYHKQISSLKKFNYLNGLELAQYHSNYAIVLKDYFLIDKDKHTNQEHQQMSEEAIRQCELGLKYVKRNVTGSNTQRNYLKGILYKTYGCIFQNRIMYGGSKNKKENYSNGLKCFEKATQYLYKSLPNNSALIGYLYADIAELHHLAGEICKQKECLDRAVAILNECLHENNGYFRGIKMAHLQASLKCSSSRK